MAEINRQEEAKEFFGQLGIIFYDEVLDAVLLPEYATRLQNLFSLKQISGNQKYTRILLAWQFIQVHHLQSLVKKPGKRLRLWYTLIANIPGYHI